MKKTAGLWTLTGLSAIVLWYLAHAAGEPIQRQDFTTNTATTLGLKASAGLLTASNLLASNNIVASNAIGIGGPANAAASLDVQGTTRGLKMPVLTTAQRDAISSPPEGLVIYNSTTDTLDAFNGSAWQVVGDGATVNNFTSTNLFYITGKGNTVIITNSLQLLPTAAFNFDTSLGDLSWREASVIFSAAASFDSGLGLSVSAASSPFGTGHSGGLPFRNMVTTLVVNNDAFFNGEAMWNITNQLKAQFVVSLSQLTSNRVWVGFGNTTWANMMASDAPAFDHFGFLFSPAPGIGEASWICATSDGTTQTTNDSNFNVITNQTLLGLVVSSNVASITFFINGSPVATNTTNLPRVSQNTLRWGCGIRTLENTVAKTASLSFVRTRARVPGL